MAAPLRSALVFQLPPSHEGEHNSIRILFNIADFNSRPRMRANAISAHDVQAWLISTPALA